MWLRADEVRESALLLMAGAALRVDPDRGELEFMWRIGIDDLLSVAKGDGSENSFLSEPSVGQIRFG
jgi:hypothetical protein